MLDELFRSPCSRRIRNENEPIAKPRLHSLDCAIEHFARHLRHLHIADDDVEIRLHDLSNRFGTDAGQRQDEIRSVGQRLAFAPKADTVIEH